MTGKFYEGPRRSVGSREMGNEEQSACFCAQEKWMASNAQPKTVTGFHDTRLTHSLSSSQGRMSRSDFPGLENTTPE